MKVRIVNPNFESDYVCSLLAARGIADPYEYMQPSGQHILPPSCLDNVGAGAELLLKTLKAHGRILLVVDSDCDGYCSSAIIYRYIKKIDSTTSITPIFHEGKQHGLEDLIDDILNSDIPYDLIICPDSSSNDYEMHEALATIGAECLVLDHHLQENPTSSNATIINNQNSTNYTNKAQTGSGVAWQFCRYCDSVLDMTAADDLMDLAALGCCGDMGSMLEMENRTLTYLGFDLKHLKNPFFCALLKKQAYSITGQQEASWETIVNAANTTSVAFYIVPLINALIRVGTATEKERMFWAFAEDNFLVESGKRGEKGKIVSVVDESVRECTNAKNKQNRIKDSAVECFEDRILKFDLLSNKILFLELEDTDVFPPELNGLIATQLANRHNIPVLIGRRAGGDTIKGSIRGLSQSELADFKSFLDDSGLFEYVQGHANAAGFSLPVASIEALLDYANEHLKNINFGENYYDINFDRIATDQDLIELITELANAQSLWGQDNSAPLIRVVGIPVGPSKFSVMGAAQDTVKIGGPGGVSYLMFKAANLIQDLGALDAAATLTIVGKPNLNEWGGRVTPQIFISDYEIKKADITSF